MRIPPEPTLAVALALDGRSMHEQLADATRACLESDMKRSATAALTSHFWREVGTEIEGVVAKELAAVPISTILVDAWRKVAELRAFADPTRHPPGEPSVATLAKHSVSSRHTIEVELLLDGIKRSTLTLDLEIVFDVEAVHLRILDGRIRALDLGAVTVSAAVDCAGKELKPFPARELRANHEFVLEHPIPIVLPDRYPATAISGADVRPLPVKSSSTPA